MSGRIRGGPLVGLRGIFHVTKIPLPSKDICERKKTEIWAKKERVPPQHEASFKSLYHLPSFFGLRCPEVPSVSGKKAA